MRRAVVDQIYWLAHGWFYGVARSCWSQQIGCALASSYVRGKRNPILAFMEFHLPLYAVQRLADGTWLVRTQLGEPLWPAVDVVAVVGAPTSAAPTAAAAVAFVTRSANPPRRQSPQRDRRCGV